MKQFLKTKADSVKAYLAKHKDKSIGIAVTSTLVLLVLSIVIISFVSGPHYTYQPVKSCEKFTPAEAQSLLGKNIVAVDSEDPKVTGDVAVSKCSYTNMDSDEDKMLIAAVAIRSAVEDEGIIKNKNDFETARSNNETETISGIGDDAYFNKTSRQLHVLNGHNWIIINYGIGKDYSSNTPEDAVQLAKLVIN